MKTTALILLASSAMALSACGTTKSDRAASGAAIGAGTGAVVGAAVAGQPWAGAAVGGVVGGVAGAAVGSMSDPNKLNFGKPIWK